LVNTERARQTAETNDEFEKKALKDQLELYKKYHLLDESNDLESSRKAAQAELDLAVFNEQAIFKTHEDYLQAKANIDAEFNKKELQQKEDQRKKKLEVDKKYFQGAAQFEDELSNIVSELKQGELDKAGDNEEKKKAINKKYADIEMGITIAKIITQTALAAITAEAELGPIAGSIMAGLMIAAGAVEVDLAVQQRNRIKGMESGLYPPYLLTTRAQDGKKFNAKVNRYPYSQMVKEPSILVGERGKEGMPEAILDGLVMKDLQMNSPMIINGLKQSIVRVHGAAPGFENGFYDNMNLNRAMQPGMFSKEDMEAMKDFTATMKHVAKHGVRGKWSMWDFDQQKSKIERDKSNFAS